MQYLHTMIRVSNLDDTLHFFCDLLGMVEISRKSNEKGRFTLVFLAAPPDDEARAREDKAPMIELTYNWDPEEYTGGRNFGHLPTAWTISTPCARNSRPTASPSIAHPPGMAIWRSSRRRTGFPLSCCRKAMRCRLGSLGRVWRMWGGVGKLTSIL